MPRFSLVVATKGRVAELERLLQSLSAQSFKDFDVAVVDQNVAPMLAELLGHGWPFPLRHIRTPGASGACRARNVGWRECEGELVLFPDDDCWYPSGFLAFADREFQLQACQILTGRATDLEGRSINGRFETQPCWVTSASVWTTSIEWVAFFQRSLLVKLGGFDESIGIGAETPWQSCESQDIVLRALQAGAICRYDPRLSGHHAELDIEQPDSAQIIKGRAYARGMGFVLRKHGANWPERLYWSLRPLAKGFVRLMQRRTAAATCYREVALGRLEGGLGRVLTRPAP